MRGCSFTGRGGRGSAKRLPGGGAPAARRRAGGLTLIELLVSIAILAVMILAFSTIVVQAQRFSTIARAMRRSNQVASSIARAIRNDLRQATQDGFLAIKQPAAGAAPVLVVTTAGVCQSLTTGETSTGSFVCYGQVANQAAPSDQNNRILCRPAYVLKASGSPPTESLLAGTDIWDIDMAQLQKKKRADVKTLVSSVAVQTTSASLRVPAANLTDIDNLWQVLGYRVSRLSILWTNGSFDATGTKVTNPNRDNMYWRGVEWDDASGSWQVRTPASAKFPSSGIEESTSPYFALWTHHDQTLWPAAVRIRFRILDPLLPREFKGRGGAPGLDYEVICNIGQ